MHEQGFDDIHRHLDDLRTRNLYRRRRTLDSPQGREVVVEGRRLLNFCSNDYLGLAGDPRVRAAFTAAIARWGTGAGASHLVCGHTAAHEALELALAEFTGRPRALLYSSGYGANVGVINALLSTGAFVFEDRLNHASLLDGGRISQATFVWFDHLDTGHLERELDAVADATGRKLIGSDGTFSMDGDQCLLDDTIAIAKRHRAWVMIDDAHGMGVHGRHGVGLVDPQRYSTEEVPVLVGTLGKAFGTAGAFVAGDEGLIETLIQRSRNYIYTTAMPSALAAATLASLEIARAEDWRREHLARFCQLGGREPGSRSGPTWAAGSRSTRHRVPLGERSGAEHAVMSGPQQMAPDPEEILHNAVDRGEPLEMSDRLEAAHLAFTLSGAFM